MDDSLRLFVQKISKLPTLPSIAQEILNAVNQDTVSVDRLEAIIEKDPTLAARILGIANSAFFGAGAAVTSVSNAIIRIGFNNVKYASLGVALMTVLDRNHGNAPLDSRRIYQHSIAVALLGKTLARDTGVVDPDDAFVCGVLHDIGLLVLNSYCGEAYRAVMAAFQDKASLLEAESAVLGFTHAEIGLWLADQWNLPGIILDTVRFHHQPSAAVRNREIVSLVHIADSITSTSFFRISEKNPYFGPEAASLAHLNWSPAMLETFAAGFDRTLFSGELFSP
ncbi:MAG: HDOD domain-containing protein [Thermodesulfovibrionales bacterium]